MVDFIKGDGFSLFVLALSVIALSNSFPAILEYSSERCQAGDSYCWKHEFFTFRFIIAILSLGFIIFIVFRLSNKLARDESEVTEIRRLHKEKLKLEIKNLKTTQPDQSEPSVSSKRKFKPR